MGIQNQDVRVAVLGCGYWGKNLVRNFSSLGALYMVCDVAEEGCIRAKEIAPGVKTFQGFEAAFEDRNVDAVVLATPAETHETLALKAFEAGKDVFVEKPMALTVKQGLKMQEKAEEAGLILMVGHLLEYHPAVVRLKEMIRKGDLGDIRYIFSNRLNFGKIRTEENALWSFAPHDIAVILRLLGESPIEVTSVGGSYVTPNLADVTVSCLHFRGGQRAHVFVSWLNPFKEQKLVIVGEKKMAVFNDVLPSGKLQLYNQRVEIETDRPVLRKGDVEVIEIEGLEPLREECQHFLDSVRNRVRPLTDGSSGVEVLRVLEACQSSLGLNGKPVILT